MQYVNTQYYRFIQPPSLYVLYYIKKIQNYSRAVCRINFRCVRLFLYTHYFLVEYINLLYIREIGKIIIIFYTQQKINKIFII